MANIVLDFLHNYQTGERRESEPATAYQYDEGHVLEAVLPEVITSCEIHYWIRGMEDADAYTPTSITPNSDGSCTVLGNIPNSYFETNGELRIYIVVTDGDASITTYEGKLHICQRSMPDDYVDDDPENEATRILTEAQAAATTATQQAQAASDSAGQAQQSAETLSGSVAQIATNTADISTLKEDLTAAQVELAKKANTDGYYEDMTVGNAEQLISTVYSDDSVPYNFRPTAGDGDRAYVDAVVGGTVCVNQLASAKSYKNSTATDTRTYLSLRYAYGSSFSDIGTISSPGILDKINTPNFSGNAVIKHSGAQQDLTCETNIPIISGHRYFLHMNVLGANPSEINGFDVDDQMVTDLTQTFGTAIADYVYNLETATAGEGVAWLKEHFPKIFNSGYIPHNPGELVSVAGVSEKRNVGFNQWDEEWELGTIIPSNGQNASSSTKIRSKNYIPVIPSATYHIHVGSTSSDTDYVYFYDSNKVFVGVNYASHGATWDWNFTIPDDVRYMRFIVVGTAYHHDICINISDPARNGEYEPYEEHTYPLDSSLTIRGIPKLKDGKLYFDGDRYLPSGQVNRRYGIVDLGTLTWNYDSSSSQRWQTTTISSVIKNYSTRSANIVSDKWVADTSAVGGENGKMFTISGYIFCYSTDGVNKPTGTLLFELATPTTETAEPYQQRQIIDADGTEEFVSTSVVPVGHETRYVPNLRAKLEKSPDSPSSDGVYIVQRSNGVNTYVPLASSATIQDIINRLTALEGA